MSQPVSKDTLDGPGLVPPLEHYRTPPGHFDELLQDGETLRAAWHDFVARAGLRPAALTAAGTRVAHQIHNNGVTYNVYEDTDGPSRPWMLDVLPLLVPASEWDAIARGLRQRARLMNAVAADVYGPQCLLHEGLLPSALVLRHPGFLRACHGVRPPGGLFVHVMAFDLARGADGRWRVVATRAQAPSGAGYALENRAVISRLFPEAFRALHVQSLQPFFATLQQMLLSMAPAGDEAPRAVLLTPGPYNETYFEHAFLAKHLGIPLVQGADLTVRHDRLFLKTVSGLRRVHAVLRRTDDGYCDPLELRADSTLGVPGLLQAWRSGHVLVANAFGTGVLESPALGGYLAGASRRLLNEPLELENIETVWGGSPWASATIRDRLANGVVKPAFPGVSMEPVFLASLDADARSAWDFQLANHGDEYVVEQFVPLSHTPVWQDERLQNRALMLRVFLVADGAGDYRIMAGGLTRIAGSEREIVSGQRGGGSKDTWIVGESAEPQAVPEPRDGGVPAVDEEEAAISSRAAESLFWLGRYAERSENCARLARAVLTRLVQGDEPSGRFDDLCRGTCLRHGMLAEPGTAATLDLRDALVEGLFDRDCFSLAFNVAETVRVAGAVRDRLSSDNWKVLSRLADLFVPQGVPDGASPLPIDVDDALEIIDRALVSLVAVGGLEMAHMTRDHGWRFLTLGRHLERLWFVASTLEDVAAERAAGDPAVLEWLLDLSDSLITYRTRHVRRPEWRSVVDLLLLDARNPRSAVFQISKLGKHVRLLPDADLTAAVADIEAVLDACAGLGRKQGELFQEIGRVEGVIGACRRLATSLADALTSRYFSHVYERPHTTVVP